MNHRTHFLIGAIAAMLTLAVWAAPVAKPVPVAEGLPAWTGLTDQNHVLGRKLEPSDLRQRVTIVVEFDAAKAKEQLLVASGLASTYNRLAMSHGENWEHRNVHYDTIVLLINRGAPIGKEALEKAMTGADLVETAKILQLKENSVSVYNGGTYAGAPDAGGEYPFYYVLGPEGLEPLAKGKASGNAMQMVVKPAVDKGLAALKESGGEWRPFYGRVAEPKFFTDLKTLLAKGKPLAAYEAKLLKSVKAADAAKAKEAQMLYDGLVQTRSDLQMRIELEARTCPHRAAYDRMLLQKYWPGAKQRGGKDAKGKGAGEVDTLSQIFIESMVWSDPDFTCKNAGEVKKIVAELQTMKRTLAKLKESSNIIIQNGAILLDVELDELISAMPSKVPAK